MERLPKDILFSMALEYDLPQLYNLCLTSSKLNQRLCANEKFWKLKLFHDYKINFKPDNLTWKKYYREFNSRHKFDNLKKIHTDIKVEFDKFKYPTYGQTRKYQVKLRSHPDYFEYVAQLFDIPDFVIEDIIDIYKREELFDYRNILREDVETALTHWLEDKVENTVLEDESIYQILQTNWKEASDYFLSHFTEDRDLIERIEMQIALREGSRRDQEDLY